MNKPFSPKPYVLNLLLVAGWVGLILLAYGPLLLHPELHTACPENDTWNLPIRWSVLTALREGRIPLWNPLSAFGIPWLATWQTETFYPGTLLFTSFGLNAWNFSGIFHLVILSVGVYVFLRGAQVSPFWAFFSASIALLNACAYNHLGSNSSMDTMAWMPWLFMATRECLEGKEYGPFKWSLFFVLQVFAGYPQIIFYTLVGCAAYSVFQSGWLSLSKLVKPLGWGLLFSAAQWLPSMEYFLLVAARLPAVSDNPHFFLPLSNLKTFFNFSALSNGPVPDYVNSPTYFYFNFYSGIVPLLVLASAWIGFKRLRKNSLFFYGIFLLFLLWSVGFFVGASLPASIPFPSFLEPAKDWVLVTLLEIFALGFFLEDLFPKPGPWKWALLAVGIGNLLYPIWTHPLETNLVPPNARLEKEAGKITSALGQGRVLVLVNAQEQKSLYTPLPDPGGMPLFKRFMPNSNLFASLPTANFYGSTWPSWGALDANKYFKYGFPYSKGNFLNLLGVDLLLLPEKKMPSFFKKIWSEEGWTLWKNPSSLGGSFALAGKPRVGDRRTILTNFAMGTADPRVVLYLDPIPVSLAPLSSYAPLSSQGFDGGGNYQVITQNGLPGWRAWVEGNPRDLYLADGIFLGVPLKPGERQIRLAYEPASFRLGLFLSMLSLGIAMGGLVKRLMRKNPA